ncbi:hypothetical protein [Blastochloris tepida]|uniref:AAA+ ATPase domain-containing protein n=1 Tax=Blastochloris tepida TaxID=2233851 RepID=A0A348FZE2_9HYPH|nr:hypothetical protein [Blastochloris tepida]BBF92675.1 hypothetical protein BLTE_13600 [Blastochloris tepida]
MTRQFVASPAKRDAVPLLFGITGPSGGGKTFSALRLATGISEVVGGDVFYIDTEAKRALHYADMFRFRHVPFEPPFGALDYLEALRFCKAQGAGVVVVDSMSHEHEGPGGLLDSHERELDRMAGDDWKKREAMNMLAWQKPKSARRALINGILQMGVNAVFCFRAKETAKPMRGDDGKTRVVQLGFMPIAGDEFVYEMTVNCLLLPGAKGVPTWSSDNVGERQMMKLPEQFRGLFAKSRPLDENIGRELAMWARGGAQGPAAPGAEPSKPSEPASEDGAPAAGEPEMTASEYMHLVATTCEAAKGGTMLREWWGSPAQKALRRSIGLTKEQVDQALDIVKRRLGELEGGGNA